VDRQHAPGGFRVTIAPVVDFLYACTGDVQRLLEQMLPGRYFCHWGTAIGCHVCNGLLSYDPDVDFVAVEEPGLLPIQRRHRWAWFRAEIKRLGYRLVDTQLEGYLKIFPAKSAEDSWASEWKDRVNVAADQLRASGAKSSRAQIMQHASRMPAVPLRGVHCIDLNVCAEDDHGILRGDKHLGLLKMTQLFPTTNKPFGNLSLPMARNSKKLLDSYYPGWRRKRLFRHPLTGAMTEVPAAYRTRSALRAMPSEA